MARKPNPEEQSNVSPDDEANCLADLTALKLKLTQAMQPVARVRQEISSMWGRYEKLGIDKGRMKRVYEDSILDNPQDEWERRTALAARLNIIKINVEWEEGGQGSFADIGRSLQKASDAALGNIVHGRIRSDGYNSGLAGGLRENNPLMAGSEEHVIWDGCWIEGAEDRNLAGKGDFEPAEPRQRNLADAELSATDA